MKKVILIGGAPGTGKTTIARQLSKELNLPWISTDQLRGVVRDYATRSQYPDLLLPEGLDTAEKFLTQFSAKEIADMEYKQAFDVWPAMKYLIEETYGWEEGVVIEGVNIVPELIIETGLRDKEGVASIFLIDEDQERLTDVVYGRGIWDKADSYSDDLKPKEVEWVGLYTLRLKEAAEKHQLPIIEIKKSTKDFERVKIELEKADIL